MNNLKNVLPPLKSCSSRWVILGLPAEGKKLDTEEEKNFIYNLRPCFKADKTEPKKAHSYAWLSMLLMRPADVLYTEGRIWIEGFLNLHYKIPRWLIDGFRLGERKRKPIICWLRYLATWCHIFPNVKLTSKNNIHNFWHHFLVQFFCALTSCDSFVRSVSFNK